MNVNDLNDKWEKLTIQTMLDQLSEVMIIPTKLNHTLLQSNLSKAKPTTM